MIRTALFQTLDDSPEQDNGKAAPSESQKSKLSITELYEGTGFEHAANMHGSREGLAICLYRIYQEFKAEVKNDKAVQEESRQPLRERIQEHKAQIEQLTAQIERLKEERMPGVKERIESIKQEIRDIRQNPEQIVGEAPGRVSFFVGVAILIFLSIYLFVFYSSASYSAFFKQFTPNEVDVANSIFDAQALVKAYGHGVTELVLILTMPFVFLGLGFLIHKFQAEKAPGWLLKISVLILVTFIFDAILAYEITEKIARLTALREMQEFSEYTLADAAVNVQFWLIIFAGFLVYIIWGFVFDFVVEEHEKLDAVSLAIKTKQEKVEAAKQELEQRKDEMLEAKQEVKEYQTEIDKLKHALDSTFFITKEFERRISAFMVGWIHWMKANKRSEDAVKAASQTSNQFLGNLQAPRVAKAQKATG